MQDTLPKMLKDIAEEYPGVAAQYSRNDQDGFDPITYKDMFQIALDFGAGLLSLGIERGDHIGLISDNRKEWQQSDMGIMAIGAADVPRGCDATDHELRFILSTADCHTVIAENPVLVRRILALKQDLPVLGRLICFEEVSATEKESAASARIELLHFNDVLEAGRRFRAEQPGRVESELEQGTASDTACIIFTSGTTGEPKGVILTHGNFIAQLDDLKERIYLYPGDRGLCVLPIWHAFERLCEYVILCQAAAICYSKPVGSILLADFQKLNPHLMPAVPRVFESVYDGVFRTMRKTGGIVYALFSFFTSVAIIHSRIDRRLFRKQARFTNDHLVLSWIVLVLPWLLLFPLKKLGSVLVFKKIRAKLGNSFRGGISGGGALPPQIDEFFWAIGVNVVEGYGLTETAPVISVRYLRKPVFGTVGKPLHGLEVRIVDEDGNILPPCTKGTVQIKGPTVMKGYYKRDDLTAKVMHGDWFDTGDLGMLTLDGELVLKGRIKDTIVLRGGENVEPLAIEMKLNESRYIAQSVIVGQDQRYLAALIVPVQEEVVAYAKEHNISYTGYSDLLARDEIHKLMDGEIQGIVNAHNGFKLFEKISRFTLLPNPFVQGETLSAKQEVMRHKVAELFAKEIAEMFK